MEVNICEDKKKVPMKRNDHWSQIANQMAKLMTTLKRVQGCSALTLDQIK